MAGKPGNELSKLKWELKMSHCKLHDVASQLHKELKWLLISHSMNKTFHLIYVPHVHVHHAQVVVTL